MLSNLINLFAAPSVAFTALRQQAHWLLPFAIVVGGVALTNFTYFSLVDPEFMVEDMLRQAGDDMSDAERQEAREAIESMPYSAFKWVSVGSAAVGIAVILLLHAVYYLLVSMFAGHGIGFKHWWSLLCWSTLPVVLTFIAGIVTLLLAGGDVGLTQLNPLTFSNLLGIKPENANLKTLLEFVDVTRIWSLVLLALGYRLWTNASWLNTAFVTLLPVVVITSIWLLAG